MKEQVNSNRQFQKKYDIDYSFFENKEKEFYYFIGLMASDGNVKNNKTFSLAQSGDSGMRLLKSILQKLNSNHTIYKYKNSNSFTITNEKIVNILADYNIVPNKTLIYKLPKLKTTELKYFLQGYIDGDGSIGIYDNGSGTKVLTISFVGTENFIKSVYEQIPIKGNIRHIKKCKNLYELRFYGKKAVDFGYFVYDDICFSNYKIDTFNEFINNNNYGNRYKQYYHTKPIIIEKLKNGESPLTLAKEYNIPYKTVYTWKMRK